MFIMYMTLTVAARAQSIRTTVITITKPDIPGLRWNIRLCMKEMRCCCLWDVWRSQGAAGLLTSCSAHVLNGRRAERIIKHRTRRKNENIELRETTEWRWSTCSYKHITRCCNAFTVDRAKTSCYTKHSRRYINPTENDRTRHRNGL